jgi:hypothetical protein
MQFLIKRIAQLRSVENGLTEASALLPFVREEAQDVLLLETEPVTDEPKQATFLAHTPQYLEELAAQLLWSIAQTTHEAMRLIEGSSAQVNLDDHWQTGILRLVVLLELQAEQTIAFDLVTLEPVISSPFESSALPESVLPENASIRMAGSLLGQQPLTAAALLQQLLTQLTAAEPIFEPLLQGMTAEWLIPTQTWQAGEIRLQLRFEFIPAHSTPAHGSSASELQNPPYEPEIPLIRFTHPDWLEQHITTTVEHQLTRMLQRGVCLSLPKGRQSNPPTTDALIAVVQRGYTAIDELQYSLTLASRTFAQQALPLDELMLRLLWGVNRTSYEVMQFTSGIPVKLLQPQQLWTAGILRYVVQLVIRTPDRAWQLDLARRTDGVIDPVLAPALAPAAIVQSAQNAWCLQPIELSVLETRLWQQIEQTAPEIVLLQTETEVNVELESQPQLGAIQLVTGFEFVAGKTG